MFSCFKHYKRLRVLKNMFLHPKITLIKIVLIGVIMSSSIYAETITKTVSWTSEQQSGTNQGNKICLNIGIMI